MRSRRILRNQKNKRKTRILRKKTNFRKTANAKTRRRSKVGTKLRYTKKNKKGGMDDVPPPVPPRVTKPKEYGVIVFDVDDTLYPHICGHNIDFNAGQITLITRIKEILKFLKDKGIILYVVTRCRPSQNILNLFYTEKADIKYTDLIPEENIFGADRVGYNIISKGDTVSIDERVWNVTNGPFDKNYSVIKSEFLNQIRVKHSTKNILFVDDDSANAVVAASRGFDCITTPKKLGGKAGGMIMTIRGLESVFGIKSDSGVTYPKIMGGRKADVVQLDSGSDSFEFLPGSTPELTLNFMNCVNNLANYNDKTEKDEVFLPEVKEKFKMPDGVTFQSLINDISNIVNHATAHEVGKPSGIKRDRRKAFRGRPEGFKPVIVTPEEEDLLIQVAELVDDECLPFSVLDLFESLENPSVEQGNRTQILKTIKESFKVKPKTESCRTTGEQQNILSEVFEAATKYELETEVPPPPPPKIGDNYIITGIDRANSELILKVNKNGSYLLRPSSKSQVDNIVYALSLKINDDIITHYILKKKVEGDKKIFMINDKGNKYHNREVTQFLNEKQNELQEKNPGLRITQIKQKVATV